MEGWTRVTAARRALRVHAVTTRCVRRERAARRRHCEGCCCDSCSAGDASGIEAQPHSDSRRDREYPPDRTSVWARVP